MPDEQATYKGKVITIKMNDDTPTLFIDSEQVPTKRLGTSNEYWTPYLGYVRFPSLFDLAKAIIDERSRQ